MIKLKNIIKESKRLNLFEQGTVVTNIVNWFNSNKPNTMKNLKTVGAAPGDLNQGIPVKSKTAGYGPGLSVIIDQSFVAYGDRGFDNTGNPTPIASKKGQWETLVKQLNKFVEIRDKSRNDVVVDVKSVILDENIDDIFDIHKMTMETLKADTHSLQLLKGAEIQHSDLMFDFKEIDSSYSAYEYKKFDELIYQLNLIKEYDKKNNFRTYLHPNVIDLTKPGEIKKEDFYYLNKEKHLPDNFLPCYAPWSSVHINVDGSLFPCMAVAMGNVKNEDLSEIIFSDKFSKFKSKIREKGTINGCNRCGYLLPK